VNKTRQSQKKAENIANKRKIRSKGSNPMDEAPFKKPGERWSGSEKKKKKKSVIWRLMEKKSSNRG